MVLREPVGLIRMNTAENVVENRPVSAAHLEGLPLATVHIVRTAHLDSVHGIVNVKCPGKEQVL
jgi:hypothetical protein